VAEPQFWITAEAVLKKAEGRVGRTLGSDGGPVTVNDVADASLRMAHGNIVTVLGNKGYTLADLAGWDYRRDYVLRMALYWFFVDLSIDGFDQERLKPYDVRPELAGKDFALIVGGVVLKPSAGETGEDGTDTDANGLPDLYGNNAFAVGRFSDRNYTTKRTTNF
jgi:hypothetical protein